MFPLSLSKFDNPYLRALEHAAEGVLLVDESGLVQYSNASAARVWGYDRSDLVGLSLSELFSSGDHQADRGSSNPFGADSLIEVGKPQELTATRCDGSRFWTNVSISELNLDSLVLYLILMRDITEQVACRDKLRLVSLVAEESRKSMIVTDRRQRIVYVNKEFSRGFGYSETEVLGKYPSKILSGPHTNRKTLIRLQRQLGAMSAAREEILAYDKEGHEIWVTARVNAVRDSEGKLTNLVAVLTNINERKQIESLQRQILEALASDLTIREAMDMLCRRVEVLAPDVVSSVIHVDRDSVLHPLAGPQIPEEFAARVDGLKIGPDVGSCGTAAFLGRAVLVEDIENDPLWHGAKSWPLKIGLRACWSTPIKGSDGRVLGAFAFYYRENRGPSAWHEKIVSACVYLCAFAIERYEARAKVAALAYVDSLTGLPNRAQLESAASDAIRHARATRTSVTFMFIDLDRFKAINDTYGHSTGDEVLMVVSRRIKAVLRSTDTVGRHGGDEFVAALPDCKDDETVSIAERILQALRAPIEIKGLSLSLSASIGISRFPEDGSDADLAVNRADVAMYEAKRAGRDGFRFFSPAVSALA